MKNYELRVFGIHIEDYELRLKKSQFNKTSSYFHNEFVFSSLFKNSRHSNRI